ncbi:MAG: hypothetical protein NTV30_10485 [Chloroflexi bacterium]|nr:hypothetical protein [Chloroflexota bacterium]
MSKDWLEDPLMDIKRSYIVSRPKHLDSQLSSKLEKYHWATRVKLEASDYFCRQIMGASSMSIDLGLYKMAQRLIIWHLDAFYFEMSATNKILMQELNIFYGNKDRLEPIYVNWDSIKKRFNDRLPERLIVYIDSTIKENWFKKIHWFNDASTQYISIAGRGVPTETNSRTKIWDWEQYINYIDPDTGETKEENVIQCFVFLKNMIEYVTRVWHEMSLSDKNRANH